MRRQMSGELTALLRAPLGGAMALATCLVLALGLVGCGSDDETTVEEMPPEPLEPTGRLYVPREDCRGADLVNAPPNFAWEGQQVVLVDLCSVDATLSLNPHDETARVSATVEFFQPEWGFPVIDLVPAIDGLVVDEVEAEPGAFITIPDPGGESFLSFVALPLEPGYHVAQIDYAMPPGPTLMFAPQGDGGLTQEPWVDYFADLSDWQSRAYLEKHFPSNYAYDTYPFHLRVTVSGETEHRVFANGEVEVTAPNDFDITFPAFFNSTCHFLHVAPADEYVVIEDTYAGLEGDIALTVYACPGCEGQIADDWRNGSGAAAMETMKTRLESFEDTYGPYLYPSLIVRLQPAAWLCASCGMEHAGATITTPGALPHEIRHSWFGRGILPAGGNAEWLDEAISKWADYDFPVAESFGQFPGAKLSGFSPYRRHVPMEAYEEGRQVMMMLAYHFANQEGGLKAIIVELFQEYAERVITTDNFVDFLNERSDQPLDNFFNDKVYGGAY